MTGLITGRFQPFHNGHLALVKEVLKEQTDIVIAIGSAQYSYTMENPFTAGERELMISSALKAEGINNFYIVPVEDVNSNSIWVSKVESLCPRFDVVYTNNPLVRTLFKDKRYKVVSPLLLKRNELSGTEIRRRMLKDEDWKSLVPKSVAEIIMRLNGRQRLLDIEKSDKAKE